MTEQIPRYSTFLKPEVVERVSAFIMAHWNETIRSAPKDDGTLLGLPYPYTVPCRRDAFQELYYWDTYFTSVGLILNGRRDLAVSNARNLLSLVQRYGFVPNGNRTYYLSRSQPPYLAPLVELIADECLGPEFLSEAFPMIAREYGFWTENRNTPLGLSHHGNHATREQLLEFFPTVSHRLRCPSAVAEASLDLASRTMSECESGWDLTSRFERRCADFCPVDLNANLYLYESLLSRLEDNTGKRIWAERARVRRETLNALCWDKSAGAWFDYDHVRNCRSEFLSAATFQPLWTGLATAQQARAVAEKALPRLESHFGIAAVAAGSSPGCYQWDYPNGWPCVQFLAYRGLAKYGYFAEARRIAEKYLACVVQNYEVTGDLWEKYNVINGSHETVQEAGYLLNPTNLEKTETSQSVTAGIPPAMMGWTAGVFLDARQFLAGV